MATGHYRGRTRQNRRSPSFANHKLRIIGGKYRGRKFMFPDIEGLRPTGDRIRETLFNWLAPYLHEARCLDLFAGSGALALEALSRGAGEVVMVERSPIAVQCLCEHIEILQPEAVRLENMDALQWLSREMNKPDNAYDIIFLDPPFSSSLLEQCSGILDESNLLHPNSLVYVEYDNNAPPLIPPRWSLHRSGTAGQVSYALFRATSTA